MRFDQPACRGAIHQVSEAQTLRRRMDVSVDSPNNNSNDVPHGRCVRTVVVYVCVVAYRLAVLIN